MAEISKITLPNGVQYDLKDAVARELNGDAAFITFDIDYSDGNLYMYKPSVSGLVDDLDFDINSSGELEITWTIS